MGNACLRCLEAPTTEENRQSNNQLLSSFRAPQTTVGNAQEPAQTTRENVREPDLRGMAETKERNEDELGFRLDVGEKLDFDVLAAEHQRSFIMLAILELLRENYACFRRINNGGSSFYRSFLFAYVEHVWETQDKTEVERIIASLKLCQWTQETLESTSVNFEALRVKFVQLLMDHTGNYLIPGSPREFLSRTKFWDLAIFIPLLKLAASNELARQAAELFFSPYTDYDQVLNMLGQGSIPHHRQLTALSDALGVPIRVVLLDIDRDDKPVPSLKHHDFVPSRKWKAPTWSRIHLDETSSREVAWYVNAAQNVATTSDQQVPFRVTLLYTRGAGADAGRYDILYPK